MLPSSFQRLFSRSTITLSSVDTCLAKACGFNAIKVQNGTLGYAVHSALAASLVAHFVTQSCPCLARTAHPAGLLAPKTAARGRQTRSSPSGRGELPASTAGNTKMNCMKMLIRQRRRTLYLRLSQLGIKVFCVMRKQTRTRDNQKCTVLL